MLREMHVLMRRETLFPLGTDHQSKIIKKLNSFLELYNMLQASLNQFDLTSLLMRQLPLIQLPLKKLMYLCRSLIN